MAKISSNFVVQPIQQCNRPMLWHRHIMSILSLSEHHIWAPRRHTIAACSSIAVGHACVAGCWR